MFSIIIFFIIALIFLLLVTIKFFGQSKFSTVKSIESPTEDILLIRLTKPKNLSWKAGSYAKVQIPEMKAKNNWRWLTIASTPEENEIVLLTRKSDSEFKKVLTTLPIGNKMDLSWISCRLSIADTSEPIISIASDVGIAAIRPIAKEVIGQRPFVLIHLNNDLNVFDKELKDLENQTNDFTYLSCNDLSIVQEQMIRLANKYGNQALYLLAGQPKILINLKKTLRNHGINMPKIKLDSFNGLK